jgi:hypothetical protein
VIDWGWVLGLGFGMSLAGAVAGVTRLFLELHRPLRTAALVTERDREAHALRQWLCEHDTKVLLGLKPRVAPVDLPGTDQGSSEPKDP